MAKSVVALIVLCALAAACLMADTADAHYVGKPHWRHHRTGRVRVRTACQGNTLILGCHRGYRVHVLAAFYGWASGRVCPTVFHRHHHQGSRHQRRVCATKDALARVQQKCGRRSRCRLRAISRVFGNPCRHPVRKYLRVRYACVFRDCRRVVRLQAKLLHLIGHYGRLARSSYGYWRRRHYLHRKHRLQRKLNHIRRRFHACFKCRRGCAHLHKILARLTRAEIRIRTLRKTLSAKSGPLGHLRWHATRWFLKRKLRFLKVRQRILRHRMRKCKRVCHY